MDARVQGFPYHESASHDGLDTPRKSITRQKEGEGVLTKSLITTACPTSLFLVYSIESSWKHDDGN